MKIIDIFFPPKCVSCGELLVNRECRLCDNCMQLWKAVELKHCYVCGKTAKGCDCRPRHINSTDKLGESHISSLVFFGSADCSDASEMITRTLIYDLKRKKDSELAKFFAIEISQSISKLIAESGQPKSDFILSYPPRTKRGITKNGFDHMKYLARYVSRLTEIPLEAPLINNSKKQQKRLSVFKRLENSKSAYSLKRGYYIKPKTYIVLDDVITSGATIEAIAKLLKQNGAKAVYPISIARPKYKNRRKIQGRIYWNKNKHS